jgi:hypothetical protein
MIQSAMLHPVFASHLFNMLGDLIPHEEEEET